MPKFHGIEAKSAIQALCIAVAHSMLKEVELLLDDGTDINGISTTDQTPLTTAASMDLTRAFNSCSIEVQTSIGRMATT